MKVSLMSCWAILYTMIFRYKVNAKPGEQAKASSYSFELLLNRKNKSLRFK